MIEAGTLAERVQVEQIVVTAGVAPGGDPDVVIKQALDGVDGHGGGNASLFGRQPCAYQAQ